MFERPASGNKAILVHISLAGNDNEEAITEFRELAMAAGARIATFITGNRPQPEAKYFVGSGKAQEIQTAVATHQVELVIFNHTLSPAQERNLEQLFKCRVVDRTGLILDIFAQRARTFEGKLQVELAQLKHMATRLVRGWTHLERQRGGIGLRGPGETQLETDRRLIRKRMDTINKRLEKVRKQRAQGRRARKRSELPTISLVGYTNAGKSTLFNQLTNADVYVANQLFATLDPTLRRCELTNGLAFILADTVGFIQDLPHDLVESFQATLDETRDASLLLHVIDAQSKTKPEQIAQVNEVLTQIAADTVPQLLIYNKIDLLPDCPPKLERAADGTPYRVWLSAKTGAGIELLREALQEFLGADTIYQQITLSANEAKLRSTLYNLHAVCNEDMDEQGNWRILVRLRRSEFMRLFPEKINVTTPSPTRKY